MDIKEQAIDIVKQGVQKLDRPFANIGQKLKTAAWETGIGPVLSAAPSVFGEQAVLTFPGRSGKFTLACTEHDGDIILAASPDEFNEIQSYINNNPAGELWLKNGWYTATVRSIPQEETETLTAGINDETFFGKAGAALGGKSLKDFRLLRASRTAPCTGTTGPGTKTWVWPALCAALLLTRGKKSK